MYTQRQVIFAQFCGIISKKNVYKIGYNFWGKFAYQKFPFTVAMGEFNADSIKVEFQVLSISAAFKNPWKKSWQAMQYRLAKD